MSITIGIKYCAFHWRAQRNLSALHQGSPVTAKIYCSYANANYYFSSVSELRDALLASYPGVAFLGRPIVLINRDAPAPAWGWVGPLLRTRTDWWRAAGIAIQHAARDGGDNARLALADMLECDKDCGALNEWIAPLANQWPEVRATLGGTGLGNPDSRLETIAGGHRKLWDGQQGVELCVEGIGAEGSYLTLDVNSSDDLALLLSRSSAKGDKTGDGPWNWLTTELMYHLTMAAWMPDICARMAAGTDQEVRAMLDWYSEKHDLWRHVEVFQNWQQQPPEWFGDNVDTKPKGWRYPIRAHGHPTTLGDVALNLLRLAVEQSLTKPIFDLDPIFDDNKC